MLDLPEVAALIGRDVEIVVLSADDAAAAAAIAAPGNRPRRRAGIARGTVEVAADFDAPLAEFAAYVP